MTVRVLHSKEPFRHSIRWVMTHPDFDETTEFTAFCMNCRTRWNGPSWSWTRAAKGPTLDEVWKSLGKVALPHDELCPGTPT